MQARWVCLFLLAPLGLAGVSPALAEDARSAQSPPLSILTASPPIAPVVPDVPPVFGRSEGWPDACPVARERPAQPAPFTPFMLGDFTGPVANMFSDVKIAEG